MQQVILFIINIMFHVVLGGFCFLPTSRIEGIRIFEMEIFLSIRQRKNVEIPNLSNKVC